MVNKSFYPYSFRLVGRARCYTSNYMNKFIIANVISTVKEKHAVLSVYVYNGGGRLGCLVWPRSGFPRK